MYGGDDEIVPLLESVFQEVGITGSRVIYERSLRDRGLAYVSTTVPLRLVDFRDPELSRLGLGRDQLVATDAAHYACTREWARWAHGLAINRVQPDGIVWHSRQAELIGGPQREVLALFGGRATPTPTHWSAPACATCSKGREGSLSTR
jgi:hypothetical protein